MVALCEDRSPGYTHGERLHVFMASALEQAGIGASDLQAIAVSKGPGSYTGLRIGVSAAKGLCFALGIPLLALPTLKVMAEAAPDLEGLRIPMLDARRMEVYAAVFDTHGRSIRETRAEIVTENSFEEFLSDGPIHLLGSGADKCREVLLNPTFHFHPEILPSAREMGPLSFEKYTAGVFEDLAYFEPYYLKDFMGKPPRSN